jgi:hypothetical protein
LTLPTFDEGPFADIPSRITTATAGSRPVAQAPANEVASKSAYATIAPGLESAPFQPSSKFQVPFDEGATMYDAVAQVDSLPQIVEKARGYHIVGDIKASEETLKKILSIGALRI